MITTPYSREDKRSCEDDVCYCLSTIRYVQHDFCGDCGHSDGVKLHIYTVIAETLWKLWIGARIGRRP